MKNKTFAVVLIAIVFLSGLWATASTPATVVAEPGDVFVDTPTAEPPTPTATWSGKLFLPIGRGDVTPTPTATPIPTAVATPTPGICVFPDPDTPGILVEEGVWLRARDGEWIVHNRTGNSRLVIRFDTVQLISLWSVDNERRSEGAQQAVATLDNDIQVQLPWTGDMEVAPVLDGPWATSNLTVTAATGDSPGIRWCSWQ
jgi:hypothetical protein